MLHRGGVLVLGELTTTLARVPMIFGTLPGWWLGEYHQSIIPAA
jgi:hypothetical protein